MTTSDLAALVYTFIKEVIIDDVIFSDSDYEQPAQYYISAPSITHLMNYTLLGDS